MSNTCLLADFGLTLRGSWGGAGGSTDPDVVMGVLLNTDIAPDAAGGPVVEASGLDRVLGGVEGAAAVVQVEEYEDCSVPLRDAAKIVAGGGRGWSGGVKRVLKMVVTDGLHRMRAVELHRCPSLDTISPGCKLVLRPPLTLQRGTLILEPHNVAHIGGVVALLAHKEAEFWKTQMIATVGKPYLIEGGPTVVASLMEDHPYQQQQQQQQPQQQQHQQHQQHQQQQQQLPPATPSSHNVLSLESPSPQQQQPASHGSAPVVKSFAEGADPQCPRGAVVVARAYVVTLCSSLQFASGTYRSSIMVDDGTAVVMVTAADSVLEGLVGIPAVQLARLQQAGDAEFARYLRQFESNLENMGAVMMTVSGLQEGQATLSEMSLVTPNVRDDFFAQGQAAANKLSTATDPEAQRLLQIYRSLT